MPIYEFICEMCRGHFEDLIRSDSDVPTCPSCGGTTVKRQLSTFATSRGAKTPCELGSCELPGGPGMCPGGTCPL